MVYHLIVCMTFWRVFCHTKPRCCWWLSSHNATTLIWIFLIAGFDHFHSVMQSPVNQHAYRLLLCSSDKKLKQSGNNLFYYCYYELKHHYACRSIFSLASEMWCLGQYLPLLIGDLIPEDDENWQKFFRLMSIVDYIFAPVCTAIIVAHLGHQIQLFLTDFKTLSRK